MVAAFFPVLPVLILGFAEGGEERFPGAFVRIGCFAVLEEGGVGEEGFVHGIFGIVEIGCAGEVVSREREIGFCWCGLKRQECRFSLGGWVKAEILKS